MAKYGTTHVIDQLAREGYCPDSLDDYFLCFNSKKHDSTVIKIRKNQYLTSYAFSYYMQISFPFNTGGDLCEWPTIISILNDHGIWPEIPTKGVFDESN